MLQRAVCSWSLFLEIGMFWLSTGWWLPKLFWPTVRKSCSSYREKIWGWRPRICKFFEITRTIYSNNERSEQFLVTECFFNSEYTPFQNPIPIHCTSMQKIKLIRFSATIFPHFFGSLQLKISKKHIVKNDAKCCDEQRILCRPIWNTLFYESCFKTGYSVISSEARRSSVQILCMIECHNLCTYVKNYALPIPNTIAIKICQELCISLDETVCGTLSFFGKQSWYCF
jgi:hypothetical protein